MTVPYGQHGAPGVYRPGSGEAAELVARIQAATEHTPYRFDPTEDGFEVAVDVPDQRWYSMAYAKGIQRVFTHRVKVDEEARKLAVTDVMTTLSWEVDANGPVPRLGASKRVDSGRVIHFSFSKTLGEEPPPKSDFTFSSEEGRQLIEGPAKRMGWRIALGRNALIGLVAAGIGGVGALVTLLLLLYAAITGNIEIHVETSTG